MPTIYVRHGPKHYRLSVSQQWCKQYDNGALRSCGLSVPEDLKESQLKALLRSGKAVEVSQEQWQHSSCQSRCILRGDAICQW
jgi:hypothetical protein